MIVLAVVLAALAGAGVWMLVRPHQYRASAEVLVTPAPFDDVTYVGLPVVRDTSSDPTRAIQTAAAMIDSPAAAAVAARSLGPGWSASRVRAAITVTPIGGTNVLDVEAVAGQARLAARIADTFLNASLVQRIKVLAPAAAALVGQLKASPKPPPVAQVDRLLAVSHGSDPTFFRLHAAAAPPTPTGAAPWRVLSVVLFAGLIVGIGAALLLDSALPRFRRRAEVVPLSAGETPSRRDAPRP